jgi:hypothetical protein
MSEDALAALGGKNATTRRSGSRNLPSTSIHPLERASIQVSLYG